MPRQAGAVGKAGSGLKKFQIPSSKIHCVKYFVPALDFLELGVWNLELSLLLAKLPEETRMFPWQPRDIVGNADANTHWQAHPAVLNRASAART
jgi:hypothetical protein